jgi:hypothetical protein
VAEFARWFVTILLVIVGWGIVHKLSAQRDFDKARREMIAKAADGLYDDLGKLFELANAYHLNARNEISEIEIKIKHQDLVHRVHGLSRLVSDSATLAKCRSTLAELRMAITGQHFEDEHTSPRTNKDPQVQLIADATLRAKRSMLELKYSQFA